MSADNEDSYNATVIGREEIHPQLIVLRVRPDGGLFDFKPGQFGVLGLLGSAPRVPEAAPEEPATEPDKMIRRAYSIASASVERRYVEFYLTLITSGQLTPRLFALKHGSRVFLGPKASGMFTLDRVRARQGRRPHRHRHGPGALRFHVADDSDERDAAQIRRPARRALQLGSRLSRRTRNPRPACGRTSPTSPASRGRIEDPHFLGRTGRIQTFLEQGAMEKDSGVALDPAQADVFLCGNPEMVKVVTAMLETKGFKRGDSKNPGNIHVEEYW